MLNAIEFKNLKGQTAEQELTGMDIFVGRNGAGKTTRIQALGISMLGYVPGHNKTPAETFKLATGESMTIGIRLDKFQFTRTFSKEEKRDGKSGEITTSIKETLSVTPGKGEKNDTQRKTRIVSEIDNFPVMMDFGEFLGLSDAKRRDFIYNLGGINSKAWNRNGIESYLRPRLLTPELQANNLEQYDVMQDLISKAMSEYPEGFGVQEGLQSMLDWVETEKKIWDRKQKDSQGAVRQISDMKNDMTETDRNIATMKTELDDLQKQLITIEKTISADAEKKKAHDKRISRMTDLQKMIGELEAVPADADTSMIDLQITEQQASLVVPPNVDTDMEQLKNKQATSRNNRKKLDEQYTTIAAQLSAIQATVNALEDAFKTTASLAGRCVVNPQAIKCDKDFSGFGSHVDKKKSELVKLETTLKDQALEVKKQIAALEKEESDISSKQSELLKKVQDANTTNTKINEAIAGLTKRKNEIMAASTDRKNKLMLYREELDRLTNEPAEAVTSTELLEKQATGLRERIENVKNTVEEKEKAKQAILLLQQSMIENRKAEYHSACLKLIAESLGPKGVQGELVKDTLEPIRQDIRHNLKVMGFDYQPFFQTESDTGKEVFQFGWINEKGHHVNFDALSTGQQTVFLAAMMVTILDRAKPKLRILVMDNLNHLDRRNFQMLVGGLVKVKDKLDNIILAGAIEFDFTAGGWRVWDLSPVVDADYVVIDDDMEAKKSA